MLLHPALQQTLGPRQLLVWALVQAEQEEREGAPLVAAAPAARAACRVEPLPKPHLGLPEGQELQGEQGQRRAAKGPGREEPPPGQRRRTTPRRLAAGEAEVLQAEGRLLCVLNLCLYFVFKAPLTSCACRASGKLGVRTRLRLLLCPTLTKIHSASMSVADTKFDMYGA